MIETVEPIQKPPPPNIVEDENVSPNVKKPDKPLTIKDLAKQTDSAVIIW